MEYPTDILGQTILPGSWIAYAVRTGNSGAMKVAYVISSASVSHIVRPTWKISIQAVEKRHDGSLEKTKHSYLSMPDRIVVLDRNCVPEEYHYIIT